MTTNPNPENCSAPLLASIDKDAEAITQQEWEEIEAAYQNYVSGHDPGESLAQVRQELLGHD